MKDPRGKTSPSHTHTRIGMSQRRRPKRRQAKARVVMCSSDGLFWWELWWGQTLTGRSRTYDQLANMTRSAYRMVDIINGDEEATLVPLADHPYD